MWTLLLALGPLLTPAPPPQSSPPRVPDVESCRLEQREGTRVLHLAGSAEERALAEGRLLADEIVACFEEYALAAR